MEDVFKSSVRSIKLVEFLKWARESFTYQEGTPVPQYGLLALPAIQRDAAWKADQVANLWDSVVRGLPLGTLMLQRRGPNQKGRIATSGAMIKALQQGWDLLDGQQRLRSLLLGVYGPQVEKDYKDLRCVWIDLHDDRACKFQVTSSSQPFGYDEKGNRLPPTERSKARERYEPKNTNDTKDTEIKLDDRFCYTHELFENFLDPSDDFVLQNSSGFSRMPPESDPRGWPPLPVKFERKQSQNHLMSFCRCIFFSKYG